MTNQKRLNGKVGKSIPIPRIELEQDDTTLEPSVVQNNDALYDMLFENTQ